LLTNDKKNKGLDEVLQALKHIQPGSHSIMVYPELGTLREIYSNYIKQELENNEIVLMLPYYEPISNMKDALSHVGVDVDYHFRQGSLLIIDAYQAFFGHNHINNEKLGEVGIQNEHDNIVSLMRILQTQARKLHKSGITVLADLGCFFTRGNVQYLLKYEKSVPQMFKNNGLKQLCIYHQRDFDSRFVDSDKAFLLDQHGRSVLMLDALPND
jgi:DcmR-like sensory protein